MTPPRHVGSRVSELQAVLGVAHDEPLDRILTWVALWADPSRGLLNLCCLDAEELAVCGQRDPS